MKVTAEQVEAAMKAGNVTRIEQHNCSLCGYMTSWVVQDGKVFFDPGCYCTGRWPKYEPRTYDDLAQWVNIQSREDIAESIWKRISGTP